jgi:(S)-2-hydroxy-acid oxidase
MQLGGKIYCNLNELEEDAKDIVGPNAYGYLSSGSESQWSVAANEKAFSSFFFIPRCLVDVSSVSTEIEILGCGSSCPIMIAPMAMQKLCAADGELAMAQAASAMQIPMCLSTMSTSRMEDVANTGNESLFFQLYCLSDRSVTEAMVKDAEIQNFKGIVVTVDAPRLGKREINEKCCFSLPDHLSLEIVSHYLGKDPSTQIGTKEHALHHNSEFAKEFSSLIDDSLTWEVVPWLRSITKLPILLKGILSAEDASLAVTYGVDAIIVSNHGGRQLDFSAPPLYCLPEIADAVQNRIPILIDGGIRRGTDVIKCLALGADACLIGRPFLWSLALGGSKGVEQAIRMLQQDIERSMALLGCSSLSDIGPHLIRNVPQQLQF